MNVTILAVGKLKDYVPEVVSDEEMAYRKAGNRKVILSAILIGFYVFSLETLGFVIATMIYEFCQMVILTPVDKKKNYVLFAIIGMVIMIIITTQAKKHI